MQDWTRCAIAHAAKDPWFRARRLSCSFGNAARVLGIGSPQAIALLSARAGRTPSEVIAALDNFIAAANDNEAGRHARRQAIIDRMLGTASKAEQVTRKVLLALLGVRHLGSMAGRPATLPPKTLAFGDLPLAP